MCRVIAFLWLFLVLATARQCHAQAAAPTELWLNTGGISWHAEPGFNEHNPALALEARWNEVWGLTAGRIARNSEGTPSRFAAVIFTPWAFDVPLLGKVHTGALGGGVDGYSGNGGELMAMAGLVAERRWSRFSLALVGFPKATANSAGAIVLFFKWRLL